MKRWPHAIAAVFFTLVLTAPVGLSAPAGYDQGVQAYKSRQYNVALGFFSNAARSAPADPAVHYYMGLCYQGMNQMTLAKQQYEWVAGYGSNAQLRSQAQAALGQLSKYSTSYAGSSSSPVVAMAGSHGGGGQSAPSGPKLSGRLQILEFYTDW
jgi:hypothetical protein